MMIGLAVMAVSLISATTANNDASFENVMCPLSSKISTERDLVFAYDEAFFTDEELRQHPNRKRYLCPHEWIKVANCTQGLCPLHHENAASLLNIMSWEPYQPALCDLRRSNDRRDPLPVNVFIFGSSFTAGSATTIQCCSEYFGNQSQCTDFHPGGDNWYCAWPGYFLRWLEQEFPHVNMIGKNFGRSGYSSIIVDNTLAHDLNSFNITQRDILFLDLSITDTVAIQQGKLFEVTEAVESIILYVRCSRCHKMVCRPLFSWISGLTYLGAPDKNP